MNQKGFATRNALRVSVLVLAGAAASSTLSAPAVDSARQSRFFQQLDTNQDGYISRREAAKLRDFGKIFAAADENRDGKLGADEFVKAESMYERQKLLLYADDGVVTAKVKASLLKDPEIRALGVSVETYKGRVLLSGFVDDARQARRALELASAVRGVASVENGLRMK